MHQDLDARLVDIVAPAVLVVDAHDRFDVAQEVALGQERLDGLADERRAAEPATDDDLEAGVACTVPVQPQADVVNLDGGAVMRRRGQCDLELARQEGEFGMQGEVLAQQCRRLTEAVGVGAERRRAGTGVKSSSRARQR